MNQQSVWTSFISARRARKVARALKAAGYGSATINACRGYVMNIANYFEPGDVTARHDVLDIICEAAGIQPQRGEQC